MKKLFLTLLLLTFSFYSVASQRQTIDDLQSIRLRTDEISVSVDVHYPNYRLGGGNGPSRPIRDCFMLDLKDSDNRITPDLKMDVAQVIKVKEGFHFFPDQQQEMTPQFKGSNVVFYTNGQTLYVTSFSVASRDGRPLKEAIADVVPSTRPGNLPFEVNLLYVRDCRF